MAISTVVLGRSVAGNAAKVQPSARMWINKILGDDDEQAARSIDELIGAFVSAVNQGIREVDSVGHCGTLINDAKIMKDVLWGLSREAKNRPPF